MKNSGTVTPGLVISSISCLFFVTSVDTEITWTKPHSQIKASTNYCFFFLELWFCEVPLLRLQFNSNTLFTDSNPCKYTTYLPWDKSRTLKKNQKKPEAIQTYEQYVTFSNIDINTKQHRFVRQCQAYSTNIFIQYIHT